MRKKWLVASVILVVCIVCLCGCTKTCDNCNNEIEENTGISIDGSDYCENCIEYCAACETLFIKGDNSMMAYEGKKYCRDCFAKKAYPITLEDNDKVSISITSYDDSDGTFAIKVKNKTDDNVSVFQEGDSVLLDDKSKCIAETDGTWSFAYVDVPANEDTTVFSSFRENGEDGWGNLYKISEGHTFEFIMEVVPNDSDNYWEKIFKVTLTPEMFGYEE